MSSIFLSHSSKDKFFVRELAEHLKEYGVKVWLDEAEIKIGESLTEKVGRAIDETDYVGVVLSKNSINSEWVQKELQVAMQKELSEKKVVILPMLLEHVEMPPFLRDKLYADFTSPERYNSTFPKILSAMGISVKESKPIVEEIIKNELEIEMTANEKCLSDFEDIRIIGLDESKTYKPNPEKLLYDIYLNLSMRPPMDWRDIFMAERSFPRHTMWRKAWIEGDCIVIYCVPEELEKYHLNDLKQDVANSNAKYRKYLYEMIRKEKEEQIKRNQEKDNLRDLKNRLKFE
ncbi:toll/interleukin-1 receptor domain-containing protein [Proteiniborus sp.]|uniref:toll/interleukin-1 receptor domain-containing protein n=1 Tax=Proteiniborus sp. TaxID=2079015 RepID=UPI0033280EB1